MNTININGIEIEKKYVASMRVNGRSVPDLFATAMRMRKEINQRMGDGTINANLIDIGQYSDDDIKKIFDETINVWKDLK